MCGRYALYGPFTANDPGFVEHWIERIINPLLEFAHYNIAPSLQLPVMARIDHTPQLHAMRWGLIPAWSKESKLRYATINARAETVHEKPAYRGAWRAQRRCLVPMTGWYEWREENGVMQPYYFQSATGENPLFVGGLWEQRIDPHSAEVTRSFALITTNATGAVAEVHDRQPLLLAPSQYQAWLEGNLNTAHAMLQPQPLPVRHQAVSRAVSNARNNAPQLIEAKTSNGV